MLLRGDRLMAVTVGGETCGNRMGILPQLLRQTHASARKHRFARNSHMAEMIMICLFFRGIARKSHVHNAQPSAQQIERHM